MSSLVKLIVPAGKAVIAPPIGPALGQKGIRATEFVKQFNERTVNYIENIPLQCTISCSGGRGRATFDFLVGPPTTAYMLKRALSNSDEVSMDKLPQGSASPSKIIGQLSCKQIYEIALVKHEFQRDIPMKSLFKCVKNSARAMGISISVTD